MNNCNCNENDCLDCWPDCLLPFCEWKSCRALNSPFCYRHTWGKFSKRLEKACTSTKEFEEKP